MAYGKQRFLNNNLITDSSMITASSQSAGLISGVTTAATGTAVWASSGSYTGAEDLLVTIEIDSVTAGKEIGQATFSWKTSATVSGWEATGVTTSATAISLGSDGKKIAWTAGSGNDFELGDSGVFWCYSSFGPANMLDLDRDTYWLSTGDTSENLVINFGAAETVEAVAIADHNLTSGATVTLQANTSDAWVTPAYTQALTVADIISFYLSEEYQYWRLVFADSSNPDGVIQIGEIYLGEYTELTAEWARPAWGTGIDFQRNLIENKSETGRRAQRIWSIQRTFTLNYEALDDTDEAALYAIWSDCFSLVTGAVRPLFVHYFYDEADTLMLCRFVSDYQRIYQRYGFNRVQLQFEEVAKTR